MCVVWRSATRFPLGHVRWTAASLAVFALLAQGSPATPRASVRAVCDAWKKRQASIRCLDVSWKETVHIPKGGLSARIPDFLRKTDAPAPATALTCTDTHRILFDATGRIRCEHSEMDCSAADNALFRSEYIAAFDGSLSTRYSPQNQTGRRVACIRGNGRNWLGYFRQKPILLGVCPLAPGAAIVQDEAALLAASVRVDGAMLELQLSTSRRVWVDPEKGSAPVRYQDTRNDTELAIVLALVEDSYWLPDRWALSFADGGPWRIEGAVTRRQINQEPSDDEFNVAIAPDTWVNDHVSDPEKVTRYVARKGGTRRVVLAGEFDGTNFDELLRTDSGHAGKYRHASTVRCLNIGVICTVVCVFILLRARRRYWLARGR